MVLIKINDLKFNIKAGVSIIEACKTVGIIIPRFCYHETLSMFSNCRKTLMGFDKRINN